MKIIASLNKSEEARYISHLDIQRSLQRTVRRADIPVAFSQGFNPHPQISFATALSVGQTGSNEWVEIKLEKEISTDDFMQRMNAAFPRGMSINAAYFKENGFPSVASLMTEAEYTAICTDGDFAALERAINELSCADEISVLKSKKEKGRKVEAQVDIKPMLYSLSVTERTDERIVVKARGRLDTAGGLNMDLLLRTANEKANAEVYWKINRDKIILKQEL